MAKYGHLNIRYRATMCRLSTRITEILTYVTLRVKQKGLHCQHIFSDKNIYQSVVYSVSEKKN